jgi:hypothetical protein
VTVYDASTNTAYKATLPAGPTDAQIAKAKADHPESTTPPSVAKISDVIGKLEKAADITRPEGTNVAGRPAYSVKLAPHHGGLVGAAEVAWDAATGTALRAGIYATGATKPVLELAATDISYGAVDSSAFDISVPPGAKVETVDLTGGDTANRGDDHLGSLGRGDKAEHPKPIEGLGAVKAKATFDVSAPAALAGQDRTSVRLVGRSAGKQGVLVTYGTGLGGIAVLEAPVDPNKPAATTPAPAPKRHHGDGQVALGAPTVDVNGTKASEIATALGTVIRFERAGVAYTVIGSVSAADAVAAARAL